MFPKKIVMLVDDNDTDNFIHRRLLELTGFCEEIVVKNSGKLALEYLESLIPTPEKIPAEGWRESSPAARKRPAR